MSDIKRPVSGGLVVLRKYGKEQFRKMALAKHAKFRKQKKEWEAQQKKKKEGKA